MRLAVAMLMLAGTRAVAAGVLDLRVVDTGGRTVPLRALAGERPTLLVLWASHCPPCRDRKSTRLNSSHIQKSRMPSSA